MAKDVTLRDLFFEDFRISLPDVQRDVAVRCPWHSDSGTSLIVNPGKGSFRCTGCDMKGDVVDYLILERQHPRHLAVDMVERWRTKRLRPDRAAIDLMKRRARTAGKETIGVLLAAPLVEGSSLSVMDALLPQAPEHLTRAAAAIGIRADWDRLELTLEPKNPDFLRFLEHIGLEFGQIGKLLFRVRGAKRATRKSRRVIVVPLKALDVHPPPPGWCLLCGRSDLSGAATPGA